MRLAVPVLLALAFAAAADGGAGRTVRAHGVALTIPAGWQRVAPAGDGAVVDPRTLLVVGTAGVSARPTGCQIAAYRVPVRGAVVVIVGWSGGSLTKPGRWPLKALKSVQRRVFECFAGSGAAASLDLGGKAYQVNVLVGGSASAREVGSALAVGRSFRLAP